MDNCGVVRDILPLYVDGVCSDASRALVDEHIASCPECAKMLAQLRDSACEDSLRRETAAVLAPRRWRNRLFAASCTLAGVLCVPASLLAAMGRSPAMDYPFSWLLLLAPALLVALAATLLPLRCRRYTGRWTLLGYTASLLLFFMACCLYASTGTAAVSPVGAAFAAGAVVLYIASAAAILPWALKELPLPGRFAGHKALAALTWDIAFALLLLECFLLAMPAGHPLTLGLGSLLLVGLGAFAALTLLRRLKMDKLAAMGVAVAVAGNALCWLIQPVMRLTGAEKDAAHVLQIIQTVLLIAAMAAGAALVCAGAWQAYRRGTKKAEA